jgi:hypothetical protein
MIVPNSEDMEVYQNGVVYVRTHFVTVPLAFKSYKDLEYISKSFNPINVVSNDGLFNAMFQNADDAKAFAKRVNES